MLVVGLFAPLSLVLAPSAHQPLTLPLPSYSRHRAPQLLAPSSHHSLSAAQPSRSRHCAPELFGENEPQLADEEFKALAGIWRVYLELWEPRLESRGLAMSLHLAAPEVTKYGNLQHGKVCPMEEILCYGVFNILADPAKSEGGLVGESPGSGWSAAKWSATRVVHAGEEDDDKLCVTLQLGNLRLEGRGRRKGLRCNVFVGKVLDVGDDPPRMCGRFSMGLLLPIKSDVAALEERYKMRIEEHMGEKSFAGDMGSLLEMVEEDELMNDLNDDCDEGVEEACDIVSKEEEAKRAWLAKLEAKGSQGVPVDPPASPAIAPVPIANDDATRDLGSDVQGSS